GPAEVDRISIPSPQRVRCLCRRKLDSRDRRELWTRCPSVPGGDPPFSTLASLRKGFGWKVRHNPGILARIIHEHFCCNRRSAATTGLRPAGSPLGPSPYCTSTPRVLTAPRAGLATRLCNFAANCHELCGLTSHIRS